MAVNRLRNIDVIVTQSGTVVPMDDVAKASALSGKLGTTQKAADSNKLDGLDSTAFLRSTAKAADSNKLDGLDSSAFARTTGLATTTDGSTALGWTGTQFKAVPVGVSVVTKSTGADGANEFVFPTT